MSEFIENYHSIAVVALAIILLIANTRFYKKKIFELEKNKIQQEKDYQMMARNWDEARDKMDKIISEETNKQKLLRDRMRLAKQIMENNECKVSYANDLLNHNDTRSAKEIIGAYVIDVIEDGELR